MIRTMRGDLIAAPADALVNPVNCVGVMGRGLALAFRQAYPEAFVAYAAACRAKLVTTGRMLVVERDGRPRWIVAFPTKRHLRHPSKLEWIVAGLADLRRVVVERDMASIAVPALGCGLGGLDWALVRPMIVERSVISRGARFFFMSRTRGSEARVVRVRASPFPGGGGDHGARDRRDDGLLSR